MQSHQGAGLLLSNLRGTHKQSEQKAELLWGICFKAFVPPRGGSRNGLHKFMQWEIIATEKGGEQEDAVMPCSFLSFPHPRAADESVATVRGNGEHLRTLALCP